MFFSIQSQYTDSIFLSLAFCLNYLDFFFFLRFFNKFDAIADVIITNEFEKNKHQRVLSPLGLSPFICGLCVCS